MTFEILFRVVALCLLLASAETLHGIVRTVVITPRIGKERSLKLGAATGSALAFGICWLYVPGLGFRTASAHLVLGMSLALFMAVFDVAIGRLLMHKPWHKIWPDFDPRTGNHLLFGLLCLCMSPLLIWFLLGAI